MVTFGPDLTLEQAIQQAVGAASMCWATPEGAGIFQEDQARAIADDLLAGLREGRWTETPPSGRPSTIPEHLAEAERLLAFAYVDDVDHAPGGYYNGDEYGQVCVAAAEVHARIAHAMTAVEMLDRPQENPSGPLPPGLASLTKLADAMDRIAAGWERDQESTFSGRRGPTE